MIDGWSCLVMTLLRALGKLPLLPEGFIVYRGTQIPGEQLALQYTEGRRIRWSGFTSTSISPKVAATLAGKKGTLLRIKTLTGRDISQFSFMGNRRRKCCWHRPALTWSRKRSTSEW